MVISIRTHVPDATCEPAAISKCIYSDVLFEHGTYTMANCHLASTKVEVSFSALCKFSLRSSSAVRVFVARKVNKKYLDASSSTSKQ